VSPKTMQRWIARGLPVYQDSPRAKLLIKPSDIERYLNRRQRPQPNVGAIVNEVLASLSLPIRTKRAA
jgi:hypothetical protein